MTKKPSKFVHHCNISDVSTLSILAIILLNFCN